MILFSKEDPFTLEVRFLSDFARTFDRAQQKAMAEGNLLTLWEPPQRNMMPLTDLGEFQVFITRQGSFTTAIIINSQGLVQSVGTAKLNRNHDRDNPLGGAHTAVRRAIQNLFVEEIRDLDDKTQMTGATIYPAGDDGVSEVERDVPEAQEPTRNFLRFPPTEGNIPATLTPDGFEVELPTLRGKMEDEYGIGGAGLHNTEEQEVRERRKLLENEAFDIPIGKPFPDEGKSLDCDF